MTKNRTFQRGLSRLFDKTSRLLKTDARYLAVGGYWTTIARAGLLLSGMVLTVGFANLLSPEKYGVYTYILSLVAIASAFSLSGLGTTIVSAAARGVPGILHWGVRVSLKWSIGVVLISLCLAGYYFFKGNAVIGSGILIAGSFTPLLNSFRLYSAFLSGKKEFRKSALYGMGRRLFPTAALLAALFLTDSIPTLLFVYFTTTTWSMYSVYRKIAHEYPERGEVDQDVVSYSKELSLMNVISNVAGYLDKVFVFQFLGAAELAIYAFASMPISQSRGSLRSIKSLVIPKMTVRDLPTLKRTLPRKAFIFFLVLVPLVLCYILAVPYIYKIFFPQYLESVLYTQVLSLTLLFTPTTLFGQAFVSHEKKRELWILTVLLPLAKIIGFVVLIPLFGIWGAVITLLGQRVLSLLLNLYLFFTVKVA